MLAARLCCAVLCCAPPQRWHSFLTDIAAQYRCRCNTMHLHLHLNLHPATAHLKFDAVAVCRARRTKSGNVGKTTWCWCWSPKAALDRSLAMTVRSPNSANTKMLRLMGRIKRRQVSFSDTSRSSSARCFGLLQGRKEITYCTYLFYRILQWVAAHQPSVAGRELRAHFPSCPQHVRCSVIFFTDGPGELTTEAAESSADNGHQ